MACLLALPDDCFWNILSFILLNPTTGYSANSLSPEYDVDSVLAFSLVCRKLSIVVEEMPVWREACLKRWKYWTNLKKPEANNRNLNFASNHHYHQNNLTQNTTPSINLNMGQLNLQSFPPNPLSYDHPLTHNQIQQSEVHRGRTYSVQSNWSTSSSYKNWKLTYLNRHNIDRKMSLFLQNVVNLGYDRLFYWQRIVSMDWEAIDYLSQLRDKSPEWKNLTFKFYARSALYKIKRRMLANRWKTLISSAKVYDDAGTNVSVAFPDTVLLASDVESITCPNYLANIRGSPPMEEGFILMTCFQYPDLNELELRNKLHFLGLLCQGYMLNSTELKDTSGVISNVSDEFGLVSRWSELVFALDYTSLSHSIIDAPVIEWSKRAKYLIMDSLSFDTRISLVKSFLFQECRFNGNKDDYYDVKNSFLNDVLSRRIGLPITLSVVLAVVGRYVGLDVEMVGFPNHFLAAIRRPIDKKLSQSSSSSVSKKPSLNYDYNTTATVAGDHSTNNSRSMSYSHGVDQTPFSSFVYVDCFNEGRIMEENVIRQKLEEMGISLSNPNIGNNGIGSNRPASPSESVDSLGNSNPAIATNAVLLAQDSPFNYIQYITPIPFIACWVRLLRNLSLVCQSRRGNFVNTHYKVISQILILSPDSAEYAFQKFQLIQNFFREDVDEMEDLFNILSGGGAAAVNNSAVGNMLPAAALITGESPIPRTRTLSESSSMSRSSRSASNFLEDRLPQSPAVAGTASPIPVRPLTTSNNVNDQPSTVPQQSPGTSNRNLLSSSIVINNHNSSGGNLFSSTPVNSVPVSSSPRPTTPPLTSSFASLPPFSPSHPTMVQQAMLREMNSDWRDRPVKRRFHGMTLTATNSNGNFSNHNNFFVGQCVFVSRRSISAVIVGWDALLDPSSFQASSASSSSNNVAGSTTVTRPRVSYWVLMDQGEKRAVMESSLNADTSHHSNTSDAPPWFHDEIGKYFDYYCKNRNCFILNSEYRIVYPDDAEYVDSLQCPSI